MLAMISVAGCSTSRGSGDDDDTVDSSNSNRPTFSCCLNGEGYSCPDEDAMNRCATGGFDLGACLEDCAPESFVCQDDCFARSEEGAADPSDCQPDPAACQPTGDDCGAEHDECESSGDCCGTLVCNESGFCRSMGECVTEFGQCDSDLDCCDGLACAGLGTCRASGCESDLDCESGNCVDGACQGNDQGDRCDSDFDCAGFGAECVDGVCWSS